MVLFWSFQVGFPSILECITFDGWNGTGMELEVDTLCLVYWKFQSGSGSWKWIGGGISWNSFGVGRGWKLPGKGGHMTLGSEEINMIFVIGFHR